MNRETYEEVLSAPMIEALMPVEVDKEVLERFSEEVPVGEDHKEDAFAGIEHEEDIPKYYQKPRCNLKLKILSRSFPLLLRWQRPDLLG